MQANWVYHLGRDNELTDYADLFVKNNISGKRLFLLTGDDLLQIGILSVGHRKELLVNILITSLLTINLLVIILQDEIGKLKSDNYRLLNFPPLPNAATTVSILLYLNTSHSLPFSLSLSLSLTLSLSLSLSLSFQSPARPLSISGKEESICILFGNLYRMQGETYKWKVFLDFEGSRSAISSVKVKTNRIHTDSHYPFIFLLYRR